MSILKFQKSFIHICLTSSIWIKNLLKDEVCQIKLDAAVILMYHKHIYSDFSVVNRHWIDRYQILEDSDQDQAPGQP